MDEIELLNDQIQEQNEMYRNYYEIQLEVKKMNDGVNKCIELVGESINNDTIGHTLENMRTENAIRNERSESVIYNELNKIKENIKEINDKIDELKKDKEE